MQEKAWYDLIFCFKQDRTNSYTFGWKGLELFNNVNLTNSEMLALFTKALVTLLE